MAESISLYRHDSVTTHRPYGVDVDPDGWLWEGTYDNRLIAHSIRTGELRVRVIPQMQRNVVFSTYAWQDKLLLQMGYAKFYLIYDPRTERCEVKPFPGDNPISWYGTKLPNSKVMLCDRHNRRALILDAPEADPRIIPFPYEGDFASANVADDGLAYTFLADPARIVRFDPKTERFLPEQPLPWPEVGIAGRAIINGIMYCADSAGGRILPFDLKSQRWLDPIPHPDHGKIFGFIGGGFACNGKAYYCLSTWAHRSRLDTKTGKLIMPEGKLTIDGRRSRFMERLLVFDPQSKSYDYLIAPPQPDGIPLLCYSWTDGQQFAVTGLILPFEADNQPGPEPGPWIVVQSQPAQEPPLGPFRFSWDRNQFMGQRRRSYAKSRSLYLPEPPWSPPIKNMSGMATRYAPGLEAQLDRRAQRTDSQAYWADVISGVYPAGASDADKVKCILAHIKSNLFYNPIQIPNVASPIAILEAHEGRCGSGVQITLAMLKAAGIPGREVGVCHHVVAEAFYDNAWHHADAMFFGGDQPSRGGKVPSTEELKADPYFADAYPQDSFAYDPELLMSEDGYQVLGYTFGLWGSEPYYSFYLGAPKELPPTIPHMLPCQRVAPDILRLNWCRSIKYNAPDSEIEYDVRVFSDRACKEQIFHRLTRDTSIKFPVPEPNQMYFAEVRAMDNHRQKNPSTWYPAARWNFVLVPPEQYGWYGVL